MTNALIRPEVSARRGATSSRSNIVFVINSLAGGGAERTLAQLLIALEDRLTDFETHVVLLDREEELHAVPAWVHKHVLDARHGFLRSARLLIPLLSTLSPVVTLSFLNRANCVSVVAARLLRYPCIISERIHTTSHFGTGFRAAMNKASVRLTYGLADQVIAVSAGVRDGLVAGYGIPSRKVRVIYNPIDGNRIRARAAEPPALLLPDRYIVGVGRLVANKNFRLLIEAYGAADIAEQLVIMGEGTERRDLERLIAELGLQGRVLLTGYVANPYPVIRGARALVSSSNAEGFPNALVEAMALGCPVVATDCESGPMEILAGRMMPRCTQATLAENGILVPTNSVEQLAQAIRIAFRADVSARYAQRGPVRADDFGVRKSAGQYWSTIAPHAEKRRAA